MPSPYQIVLSGQEQAVLAARARSVRGPCRDRLRATIVLAAAAGQASAAIARELGVCADTVRKWRRRFTEGRLAGLAGAPRSGRPPVFTAADRAEVIALACALPAESGVPLPKWSCPDPPANWPSAATSRSRHPRSAGGWPATRSSPGSTGPGSPSAIRSSRPGPPGYWTCTPGLYFSVVQRKALTPKDFTSLDHIRERLAAFEIRYNAIARPFTWRFTRTDLSDLLRRIDAHDKTQPNALAA